MIAKAFKLLLILIPDIITAQPADFVNLQKTGKDNYKLIYSQYYDGESLWGYMDGGADLYLEYGFDGLLVQEIEYKGSTIKCEIYKMNDALAAFGIFSVLRHKCKTVESFENSHCINNYQVQFIKGRYYFSMINQSGDSTAQNASLEIASWFAPLIAPEEIAFPDYKLFNQSPNLIFIKGEVSLGNMYPQALNYLDNTSDFKMWLVPAENKKAPVLSIITFDDAAGLEKYGSEVFPGQTLNNTAERKLKRGGTITARKIDNNTVLQIDGKAGKDLKKLLHFE
ncbi:MAG TPA: DUF6599 family protein [Bacteroidales bacterium]|nr:DUF6599 family protein [Bacteroidales bacterium]